MPKFSIKIERNNFDPETWYWEIKGGGFITSYGMFSTPEEAFENGIVEMFKQEQKYERVTNAYY